jgi:hypothetical protein
MELNRPLLDDAVTRGLLNTQQAQALWSFLQEKQRDRPGFRPAHILYYLGGLIAIGAMTLFMTLGWERFGGAGLLLISLLYGAAALALTEWLLFRKQLAIPAGIVAVLAVVMVPLAVYGAQRALGWWEDGAGASAYRDFHRFIDWRWLLMELATLAAAALALWRYRLPFLVMPLAVTLWYMGMDIVPLLLGAEPGQFFSAAGQQVSLVFGLLMLAAALWVELRTRPQQDYAFWLHLFGLLTFWGALSSMNSGSEWGKLAYALINLLLIAAGALLVRRVYAVFGGLGLAAYLGHLSYSVFRDSLLFPLALTALGLLVIGAGLWWQRHEAALTTALRAHLPAAWRELLAHRHA